METTTVIVKNWLTKKPYRYAYTLTVLLTSLLLFGSLSYFYNFLSADDWMPASREMVFTNQQYWRAWTTLFAHADFGHLLSNAALFIPFSYLLIGYYGSKFFPFFGFLAGGLTNFIVLQTMPNQTFLIGISGLVYWMGAAWLTLFLLIDRRRSVKRRFATVLFVTVALFIPQIYKPEVSYLSHLVGFVLGIIFSIGFYLIKRKDFDRAEVKKIIIEEPEEILSLENDTMVN